MVLNLQTSLQKPRTDYWQKRNSNRTLPPRISRTLRLQERLCDVVFESQQAQPGDNRVLPAATEACQTG